MPYGSYRTQLGVGIESAPGTAVAPTVWLPCNSPQITEQPGWYQDARLDPSLGRTSYATEYQQITTAQIQLGGAFYPAAVGPLLLAAMGASSTTNATTATAPALTEGATSITFGSAPSGFTNGQAFTVDGEANVIVSGAGTSVWELAAPLRQSHSSGKTITSGTSTLYTCGWRPPTLTITDNYGVGTRQYPYGAVAQFGFTWSADTETDFSAQIQSRTGSSVDAIAADYDDVPPFMGWPSGFAWAGSSQTNLQQFQVTIANTVTVTPVLDQPPNNVLLPMTQQSISGQATLTMESDEEYDAFRSNTHPSLLFAVFDSELASGLMFRAENTTLSSAVIDRSTNFVQVQVHFNCDYSVPDQGGASIWVTTP